MTDNYIQINDKNIIKLKIKTNDGEFTGEELTFDINDIELPLLYQEMLYKLQKNKEKLMNDFRVIDKRQDVKGKKLFSKNQEDKLKAYNDFCKKMIDTYNIFLGENGVQKLLNGRKMGWDTLNEIDNIIEKEITPRVVMSLDDIKDKIIEKYGQNSDGELK